MNEASIYLVMPNNIKTLEELETWKYKWNYLTSDEKKISNDISIVLYGFDNIYRYNAKKAQLYSYYNPDEDPVDFDMIGSTRHDPVSEASSIEDIFKKEGFDIENAMTKVKEVEALGYVIMIIPELKTDITADGHEDPNIAYLKQLEDKAAKLDSLTHDMKEISNNYAIDIFGLDNDNLYTKVKNAIINLIEKRAKIVDTKADIINDMRDTMKSVCEFHNNINRFLALTDESNNGNDKLLFESCIKEEKVSDKEKYMDTILPYFLPEEMEQLGIHSGESNLYSSTPNIPGIGAKYSHVWFEEYKALHGEINPMDSFVWESSIKYLSNYLDRIRESGDEKLIADTKQSILECGWNPEIPYTHENAVKARERRSEKAHVLDYVDLTEFASYYKDEPLNEGIVGTVVDNKSATGVKKIRPIYICLLGINSKLRSRVIKQYTKSEFSHAMISLDPSLDATYSFSTQQNQDGTYHSGFNPENPEIWLNTDKDATLAVHTLFVTDTVYNRIKDIINWYIDHRLETKYDLMGILRIPFKLSADPAERFKMICSQFVYSILNIANIYMQKEKSANLVTPEDIYRIEDPRIYKMYHNRVDSYKPNVIKRMVKDAIANIDTSLFESVTLDSDTFRQMLKNGCSIYQLREAMHYLLKETKDPSQYRALHLANKSIGPNFDDRYASLREHRVLLTEKRVTGVDSDDKKIVIRTVDDVNTEYFKCHRNLMSYEKAGNYEGMKDELCKLKYLDNFAVKHMKNKKSKHYKEYADAHARITNDFNKYLKIVTDREPDFNFSEYYRNSEWYDGEVTISKQFLEDLLKIFEILLKKFPIGGK
ncbi:MAG: hypothetical protein IKA36_01665 [Clostridia bacterium]|nr:hypothetical protein [Clostridia bacterium]